MLVLILKNVCVKSVYVPVCVFSTNNNTAGLALYVVSFPNVTTSLLSHLGTNKMGK